MATSTLIQEKFRSPDWFAEPLTTIAHLFASRLPADTDDGKDLTPGATPDRLPPPTSATPTVPGDLPGEPVDTSQFRPAQPPAASADEAPSPE